jgi:DNA-directed RNA polymerase subunit M/transcription elongation factor TFIIS
MALRQQGREALATLLKQEANIKVLEQKIHTKVLIKGKNQLDPNYKDVIYQVVGDILTGKTVKDIFKGIDTNHIGRDHPFFNDINSAIKERQDYITNPYEVVEGVLQCRAILKNGPRKGEICGSWRTFSYSVISRSCDEGETTRAQCAVCHNKWTIRG